MKNLYCILGKSGSGKTTFLNSILYNNINHLNKLIYCTTRAKRDNEKEGKDYYFYTEEAYQKLADSIIESRDYEVFENNKKKIVHYFTLQKSLSNNNDSIGAMSPYQYRSIKKYIEDNNLDINLYIIYIDASNKNRLLRSLNRINDDNDILEICRRLLDENDEFSDVLNAYPNMYSDENCLKINNNFNDIAYTQNEIKKLNDFIKEKSNRK